MPEVWPDDLSKEAQLSRSPGKENRTCPDTGEIVRNCNCFKHQGARNRNKGKAAQRNVRKGLEKAFGVQAGPTVSSTADEENWHGLPVRVEAKAGRYANAVGTFYRMTKLQSDAKKSIGNTKPFIGAAKVDGMSKALYVIYEDDLIQLFEEARR